jgi:ATP-binding cassette subfamily B multidrug efflux pump
MFKMFSWFEKLIEPFPIEEPEQPPKTLLAFCWHYSKAIWPALIFVSILGASVALLEVVVFSFLGNVVEWLSSANRETFLADNSNTLIFMAVILLVVLPIVTMLWTMIVHQTVFGNYPMIIRWQAHRYLLGQSLRFYQDEFAGRIATKVMQAALGVRETVMKVLDVFVYVVVYFIGALVLIASLDLWLALPFVVWFMLYVICLRIFLPRMRDISKLQANARSLMTGRVVDSYTNISTVKLFAHAGHETVYAKESMEGFLNTVHPQMRISSYMHIALTILNKLLLFAVGAVAIILWLNNESTVAAVAVAVAIVTRLNGMSHWIMWEMAGLFENIGMAIDGMNTIAQPREVLDHNNAGALDVTSGEIQFDHVNFHYDKVGAVIEDLTLTVRPGEKIGLVGRSGAGKTTMMNILLRLYDITDGQILIDGTNIASVSQDSLRSQIGVVTQDTSLLHRSVRENIAYGRNIASDEEMIKAAKRANAHDFIQDLEDGEGRKGYDAHVGERGVKLSGGQRQRIAIARVFLKDAPILVLDEATSALDSEVEAAIQENLLALMEGKTVIAIAHRLSTIAALDRLIVLDMGKIIEDGSHEELIDNNGLYAQLWKRQSGGFLELPVEEELTAAQ